MGRVGAAEVEIEIDHLIEKEFAGVGCVALPSEPALQYSTSDPFFLAGVGEKDFLSTAAGTSASFGGPVGSYSFADTAKLPDRRPH